MLTNRNVLIQGSDFLVRTDLITPGQLPPLEDTKTGIVFQPTKVLFHTFDEEKVMTLEFDYIVLDNPNNRQITTKFETTVGDAIASFVTKLLEDWVNANQ